MTDTYVVSLSTDKTDLTMLVFEKEQIALQTAVNIAKAKNIHAVCCSHIDSTGHITIMWQNKGCFYSQG